jgi:hypothetical protein
MRKKAVVFAAHSAVLFAALFAYTPMIDAKVSEASLREHISVLASDEFEGREPGTPGEQKTIDYIANSWKVRGLVPAAQNGGWFEPVPLVQYKVGKSDFVFSSSGRTLKFNTEEIVLIGTESIYQKKAIPVVFGGYGFKADGQTISNVAGKIVLLLTDKPTKSEYPKEGGVDRSTRTARESIISAGAEGVILVADGEPGNWSAMRRRFSSGSMAIETLEKKAPIEGGISSEFAVGLVTAATRDWDKLRGLTKNADFDTVDLGINAALNVSTNVNRFVSNNVIGKIPGKKKGSGSVLFLAHWDHLGICRPESDTDRICNGAVDNASGIAVITEVAKFLRKGKHDRDIYFLATTAEEKGLLGAKQFASKPVVPLDQIVIALNIDTIAVSPAGASVAIVGRGKTNLDPIVDGITRKLRRKVDTSNDVNAYYRRQDGLALSEKGVPAIMVGGSFSNLGALEKFLASDYHGPNDELSSEMVLSGAAQDADLHIELGKYFASTRSFKGKNPDKGNKTGS